MIVSQFWARRRRAACLLSTAALGLASPAVAAPTPGVSISWEKRGYPQAECVRRGQVTATSLGVKNIANGNTVWFDHNNMATGVRCDIPDVVLIVTAANANASASAEHQGVMRQFRSSATAAPVAATSPQVATGRAIRFPLHLKCTDAPDIEFYKLTANDVLRKNDAGNWVSEFSSRSPGSVISRNNLRIYTQGPFEIIFDPATLKLEFTDDDLEERWGFTCEPTASR